MIGFSTTFRSRDQTLKEGALRGGMARTDDAVQRTPYAIRRSEDTHPKHATQARNRQVARYILQTGECILRLCRRSIPAEDSLQKEEITDSWGSC